MRRFALLVVVALAIVSCGDDGTSGTSGSSEPTIPASIPATAAASTSAPSPIRWSDADGYPSGFVEGCCGANASGPTSPALTATPAPLANGSYSLEVVDWSPTDPNMLRVSVRAFVACADGVEDCWPMDDGSYLTDEIGFSEGSREIDMVLDDSVVVYLGSTDATGTGEDGLTGVLRSTSGEGFAALMSAIADAYDTAVAAPLSAGTPLDDIVAGLQRNPAHGFTSAAEQMTGELYFTYDDAPPILFQVLANDGTPLPRSGTSAVFPRTFTVEDGKVSLEFYAGFRS